MTTRPTRPAPGDPGDDAAVGDPAPADAAWGKPAQVKAARGVAASAKPASAKPASATAAGAPGRPAPAVATARAKPTALGTAARPTAGAQAKQAGQAGAAPVTEAPATQEPGTTPQAKRAQRSQEGGFTVAVTGPTGAIGKSVVRALEGDDEVDRILGMARRPFDPAALGWHKTHYRQGDILDRAAVTKLVAEADVVVHLAYAIVGGRAESHQINVAGSRNVFEAASAADRPYRFVYTSSAAAYGYHRENPVPLTEDVPARGSPEHYYSAHKAECEALLAEAMAGSGMQVYVLRPCVVVGPDSTELINSLLRPAEWLPEPARGLFYRVPLLSSIIPDPGIPAQLVHEEDVATAVLAAVLGAGPPGVYNLAGEGEITLGDAARALGDHAVRIPHVLVDVASLLVSTIPGMPVKMEWIHAARRPVLMDTTKARRELGWVPKYTAREALEAMARAAKA